MVSLTSMHMYIVVPPPPAPQVVGVGGLEGFDLETRAHGCSNSLHIEALPLPVVHGLFSST